MYKRKALAPLPALSEMGAIRGVNALTHRHVKPPEPGRLHRLCPLVTLAVLSLLPTGALAQVSGPFVGIAPRASSPASQGQGADQFTVSPTITTVYDSNILRLNDTRSGSTPRDDIRVTPAVAVSIRQGFARNTVSLSGDVGYDFYHRFKGLQRLRTNLNAGARIPFGGRCEVSPAASLQIQQAELEDLGVAVGRTARVLAGQVVARCPRVAGFYPVVRGDIMRLTNSGGNDGLSRKNWSATSGIVYARPSLGQVQLFANTAQFRRSSNVGGVATGANIASIGLQFDRAITSRFATRLSVTGIRVDPTRVQGNRFEGINYSIDIRIAPFPALILSPVVSRQVVGSVNTGSDYILSREFALGLNWSVSARTGITAQIGKVRRKYFGEDSLIRPQLRIADQTNSGSIAVRYAVRSLRLQLGVSHRQRDSRNDFYDFDSTRVELSARTGF